MIAGADMIRLRLRNSLVINDEVHRAFAILEISEPKLADFLLFTGAADPVDPVVGEAQEPPRTFWIQSWHK